MTSERTKAMDDLIAQDADLIEFMASDAACYLYPDEGQKAERAAYTRGCAEQAAEIDRLREELAEAYIKLSGKSVHASDCATSNAPAMEPGPCNCDAEEYPHD